MSLAVIGAGYGRTATTSLKRALEALDFGPCYHMIEVGRHAEHRALWLDAHAGRPLDWDALFAGYRSAVDWPVANHWAELAVRYPEAKVILTLRDPDSWYDSVMNTIYATSAQALRSEDPRERARGEWTFSIIWDSVFDRRLEDRARTIELFQRHNARVRSTVPAGRLLVLEAGAGWEPLCDFLGVPVPADDYPHTNTTPEFRERSGLDAGAPRV